MQATLNIAKRLMVLSKRASPGASAMSNIPFMAASSNDGLESGIYQKPDIHKQDLYASRAEKNEGSRRQYISPGRSIILEIEISLETILEIVLEIHKTEIEE